MDMNTVLFPMFCKKNVLICDKLNVIEPSFKVLDMMPKFYIAVYVYDVFSSLKLNFFDTLC